MEHDRSLGDYPLWVLRADMSGSERRVFDTIYWSIKQDIDGSFEHRGYCLSSYIRLVTQLPLDTIHKAIRSLCGKGYLRAERADRAVHKDERRMYAVPYLEPSADLRTLLHQKNWKVAVTEKELYASRVRAEIANFTSIDVPDLLMRPSFAALANWGKVTAKAARYARAKDGRPAAISLRIAAALYVLTTNAEAAGKFSSARVVTPAKPFAYLTDLVGYINDPKGTTSQLVQQNRRFIAECLAEKWQAIDEGYPTLHDFLIPKEWTAPVAAPEDEALTDDEQMDIDRILDLQPEDYS